MNAKINVRLISALFVLVTLLGFYACEKIESGLDSEISKTEVNPPQTETPDIIEIGDLLDANNYDDNTAPKKYCLYVIDTILRTNEKPESARYVQGATVCLPCPASSTCARKDNKKVQFDEGGKMVAVGRYSGGGPCAECPEGGIVTSPI